MRVNKQINSRDIFLIDENGEQKGVVSLSEALSLAEGVGLDLVEVVPNAKPPVCKILDFGKYCYEQDKKMREAKKNQTVIKIKEVRMQIKVGIGDMKTKCIAINEFLKDNCKVKVSVRFRGREMQHQEIGVMVLDKIKAMLAQMDVKYNLDTPPQMEGRMISMMLSPFKNAKSGKKNPKTAQETEEKSATEAKDSQSDK